MMGSIKKSLPIRYNYSMVQRDNDRWLDDLTACGNRQVQALEDLHAVIVDRLRCALLDKLIPGKHDLEGLIEAVSQKILLYVQENLNAYDHQSGFTTWVLKLAVRQVLLDIRQLSFHLFQSTDNFTKIPPDLKKILEDNESLHQLHSIFKEELSENQREAIRAMVMFKMPKEEVALKLGMERCDYFKMIHDARLRLKRRLEADGWLISKTIKEDV